jgi:hypothetical protein
VDRHRCRGNCHDENLPSKKVISQKKR